MVVTKTINLIEEYLLGELASVNLVLGIIFLFTSFFMFYAAKLDWKNKVKVLQIADFGTAIYLMVIGCMGVNTYMIINAVGVENLPKTLLPVRWTYVIALMVGFRLLYVYYIIKYRPYKK